MPDSAPARPPVPDGWLDRPLLALLRVDRERMAWALLLAFALAARLAGLGERAMSHDESLHALFSWKLYNGDGYQHDPLMHGPLKFVLNTAMYALFGVNDWSARIQVALFGVLMVWLVWHMRGWLGKTGAFLAAAMYTISPALVYHSRYIRDEVMLTALLVLLAVTIFRYLETRATKWLVWTAVALGLAFTTMEASFIFGGLFGIYLLLAVAAQLAVQSWRAEPSVDRSLAPGGRSEPSDAPVARAYVLGAGGRPAYLAALVAGLPLTLLGVFLLAFKRATLGLPLAVLGAAALGVALVLAAVHWRQRLRDFPELDIALLLFTLVMPFLSPLVMHLAGWDLSLFKRPTTVTLAMWPGYLALLLLFAASVALGWYWLRRRWLVAAGLFWAIEVLLFTTFLTNGLGLGTGLIGSLGYWIDQQEVMRGGQPWYYFMLLVPLYEFLPLLGALAAGWAWLRHDPYGRQGVAESNRWPAAFVTFLLFWSGATWLVFTYVGEKMPWHVVYFTTPMALLAGWWFGRQADAIDWAAVRAHGGWWLAGLLPLALIAGRGMVGLVGLRNATIAPAERLGGLAAAALAVVMGAAGAAWAAGRVAALGWTQSRRLLALAAGGLLLILTFAVSYRFAFINYDYPTEPMVYAHGTPDFGLAMDQIAEISRKTVGGHNLALAYDEDALWPLEWYLREYPQRVYFGAEPTAELLDAPVVLVGAKGWEKAEPFLGDRYLVFTYRLIWWPRESYAELTPAKLRDWLGSATVRSRLWDVVAYRRFSTPTAEWQPPYVRHFRLYVRKDVAAQVWDWRAEPQSDIIGLEYNGSGHQPDLPMP